MNDVRLPLGFRFETLSKGHQRRAFDCGQPQVTDWLRTKALQNQEKRLSATKVLMADDAIAGFFTLATGQVAFSELPDDLVHRLPKRALPVAVLAWLGVHNEFQGRKLGNRLLAKALRDCHEAGQTFAFVAVILDCVDDAAKSFYQRWNFAEVPGNPYRLFLSAKTLSEIIASENAG